jgi:hypothetical protein
VAGRLTPITRWQINVAGRPAAGALLYSWLSGTSTPKPVYADAALGSPYTIPVEADVDGVFPPIFLDNVAYRIEIRDADGNVIYPAQDDVTNIAALQTVAALSVLGRSTNSAGLPVDITAAVDGTVLRRSGTALDFGAVDLSVAAAVTGVLPQANGGTGVADGTPFRRATGTILNAAILTLPTTPINLIAAPGAGFWLNPLRVLIKAAIVGAYTNVNADAYLNVHRADWTGDVFSYLVQGDGGDVDPTGLIDLDKFLGTIGARFWNPLQYGAGPGIAGSAGTAFDLGWGLMPDLAGVTDETTYALTTVENQPLQLAMENQGAGILTGGHASNTLRYVVDYTIETI